MTLCKCGCGEEIIIKKHHKSYGIPKYIWGHNGKNISETTRKKLCEKRKGRTPNLGKHPSEESKRKNSESHSGIKNHFYNKHHTEKCKKHHSIVMKGRYIGNKNPMYGKTTKGWSKGKYYDSPLQGKVYLRSSYEIAYAKYLDANKILWMYEMETFDLGNSTYTPDFYLPKTEQFIEIKGYMTDKAQEKINKFLEQYPWDLQILYKEDLIKLGCDF